MTAIACRFCVVIRTVLPAFSSTDHVLSVEVAILAFGYGTVEHTNAAIF
jgi:hypothetical protein